MIYLDHNATSPLLPEILDAMTPWLGAPCNPASAHHAGQRAAVALEDARDQIGRFLGRPATGVVFTSGATEANQAWFYGIEALGCRVVAVSALEHPCVWGAAHRSAMEVHTLPSDASGRVQTDLPMDCTAVSLMAANHETGVIQPGPSHFDDAVWVHVDATQAAGRVPLALDAAHAVVISGHKLGAPSGIGVLSLRGDEAFPALLAGGSQERGRRAGTVNVPGAVGLAAACRIADRDREARVAAWTAQQSRLEAALIKLGARIVGSSTPRLPQTTCAVFPGVPNELVVQAADLQGIAISAGAACASGSTEPSPVLTAMGDPDPTSGIRISQGPNTTPTDIEAVIALLQRVIPAFTGLD